MKKILLTSLLLLFSISLVACSDKKFEDEIVVDEIDVKEGEEADKVFVDFEKGTREYYEYRVNQVTYGYAQENRYQFYLYYRDLYEAMEILDDSISKAQVAKEQFAETGYKPGELVPEFAKYDEEDLYDYMVYAFGVEKYYDLADDLQLVLDEYNRTSGTENRFRKQLEEQYYSDIERDVNDYRNRHPEASDEQIAEYEKMQRERAEEDIERVMKDYMKNNPRSQSTRSLNSSFIEAVQTAAKYW